MSNGPGELYTWTKPILEELRKNFPEVEVKICLIPCQFASGEEYTIAQGFKPDGLSSTKEFLKFLSTNKVPEGMGNSSEGFVLSLGGNANFAIKLAQKLNYKSYYYSFNPFWHKKLTKAFAHDEKRFRKIKKLGAKENQLLLVGNLVADAVNLEVSIDFTGQPKILLFAGSRNLHSISLIPLIIGVADILGQKYPNAGFVWPVSRLLSSQTIEQGIAGASKDVLEGMAGTRKDNFIITPHGSKIAMVAEEKRYAYMKSADLAITIPGTNTLELGIAGLVALVILPVNKLEHIPLEGLGQWLGYIPIIGKYLKRYSVKLFLDGLKIPFSLPNRFSGQDLMLEYKGKINPQNVAAKAISLLEDKNELARRRAGLKASMPKAGAAKAIVASIMKDFDA